MNKKIFILIILIIVIIVILVIVSISKKENDTWIIKQSKASSY